MRASLSPFAAASSAPGKRSRLASGAATDEDGEQHQHHVDERCDIDLVHFVEGVLAVIKTYANGRSS